MSSSLLSSELLLQLSEEKVSNKHYQLSKSLCEKYGAYIEQSGNTIKLRPYDLSIPSRVLIPGDASMIGFAVLFSVLHKCVVNLSNCPNENDFLGCEILREKANLIGISWDDNAITPSHNGTFSTYDLTDCNDLITPMAITLAVSNGGILSGISHTRYKESNRLEKTIQLMNDFGIEAIMSDDVMIIQGGQTPKSPKYAIETYHDHRIYMSAVALLTLIGGELKGLGLHEIADPNFMSRLGIAC